MSKATDDTPMEEYNALMQTWLTGGDIAKAYHAIGNMVSYEEQMWTNRKIAAQLTRLCLRMGDNFDAFGSLDSIIKNKLTEQGISFTEDDE